MSQTFEQLIVRLTALASESTQEMYKEMSLIGLEIVGEIKADLSAGRGPSSHSGRLSRSVQSRTLAMPDQIVTTITAGGPDAPYGYGLEYGNPPHMIYPRDKKALMFDGHVVVRKVRHPGNQPFLFVTRRVEEAAPSAQQRMAQAVLRGLYGS